MNDVHLPPSQAPCPAYPHRHIIHGSIEAAGEPWYRRPILLLAMSRLEGFEGSQEAR